MTWHNASMWLVAFPWTFMAKRSIAKSRPRVEVVIAKRTSHVVVRGFGVVRGRFGLDRPGE